MIAELLQQVKPYWTQIKYGFGLTLLLASFFFGKNYADLQWQREFDEQEKQRLVLVAQTKELEKKAAEATTKVVTKYVDRVITVTKKGEDIVREIPVYISKDSDTKCVVPVGFVRIHDAAARNEELPKTTGDSNEEPSDVKLSEAARTITGNYNSCNSIREQLISLQEWVREQERIDSSR